MKRITLAVSLILTTLLTVAAQAESKKFKLHYRLADKHFEVQVLTSTYEEAIVAGAQPCFNFFLSQGLTTHDQKLDAVDTCANPRLK